MPLVQIQMIKGRSVEQKRKLVEDITRTLCETVNVPPASVRIVFEDMEPENYALGGVLKIDEPKK